MNKKAIERWLLILVFAVAMLIIVLGIIFMQRGTLFDTLGKLLSDLRRFR